MWGVLCVCVCNLATLSFGEKRSENKVVGEVGAKRSAHGPFVMQPSHLPFMCLRRTKKKRRIIFISIAVEYLFIFK